MVTGTHPIVRDSFVAFTSRFEGRIRWPYLDAKSIVTAAIGIALPQPSDMCSLPWMVDDRAATHGEMYAAWATVHGHTELAGIGGGQPVWQRLTDVRLPLASLDGITLERFDANDGRLSGIARWGEFPADAQLAVHSMAYAMGVQRLYAEFPRFMGAIVRLDFATAASEAHMSELGNAPLKPRNIADKERLLAAAQVIAEGAPRDAFYGT